ncbi:MAG: hypothetical protein ACLFPF_02895 [Halanaerobiales bacterium]
MRRKYGIFVVIIIILLAGFTVTMLNRFYSFDYLYNSIIRRDFAVNPRVEINPEKTYEIRIWHYPFYRMIKDSDEKEFFKLVQNEVNNVYPNIKIYVGEINFSTGQQKLVEAIKEGNPPDIYFNLTDFDLIDEELQIPVSSYIDKIEQAGFYTVNWNKISHRDKLWGWPLLTYQQFWLSNKRIHRLQSEMLDFRRGINYLEENSLLLNYYDEILLKQLLTIVGLDTFKLEGNQLDLDSYRALEEVFNLLYKLRKDNILYNLQKEMPDVFLKELLVGESAVIGPVNPYLFNFIKNEERDYFLVHLDDIVKTYSLNIFRQRRYKGDDHTRAVMETARVISQKMSSVLAEDLNMSTAYIAGMESEKANAREVLQIGPEYWKYWDEVIIPVWLDFWEEDLTPDEVMKRLR